MNIIDAKTKSIRKASVEEKRAIYDFIATRVGQFLFT